VGTLRALAPTGWRVECQSDIEIEPGGRLPIALTVTGTRGMGTVRLTGEFGGERKAVLSLRFLPE
jgi:hypothetical protein